MKTKVFFRTLVAFVALTARTALGQAGAESEVAQIAAQRVFPSPIEWLGAQEPPEGESALLLSALRQFDNTNGLVVGLSALEDFLTAAPTSTWAPSVHVNLAEHYRQSGRYSLALTHWEEAWNSSKRSDTANGKLLAARSIAGWTRLLASLGEKNKARALLTELDSLDLPLGTYGTTIESTKGGLIMMDSRPGDAYRCGSYALGHVARALKPESKPNPALFEAKSPDGGFRVSELLALAQSNGVPMEAVWRPVGGELIIPSVAHWKLNHYAAIVEQKEDRYRVIDPTFGGHLWMDRQTIDAEASGAFLVPKDRVPANWGKVSPAEAATIYGKGWPNDFNDWDDDGPDDCDHDDDDSDCDPPSANDGPGGDDDPPPPCPDCGMPQWNVSEPYCTVWLSDIPLSYRLSNGRMMRLHLRYKHRGEFKGSLFGSFGDKWECNWLGLMETTTSTPDVYTNHLTGGGLRPFATSGAVEYKSARILVSASTVTLVAPTGGRNAYGLPWVYLGGVNRYLLTRREDKYGRAIQFRYLTNGSSIRLTNVLDWDGRTNSLSYTNTAFTNLITAVTDPYGRAARFIYDSLGRLTNIIDAAGMSSYIQYDGSDNVTVIKTPYGQTSFNYFMGVSSATYQNSLRRALLVTEATGEQLFQYCDYGPPGPIEDGYGSFRNTFHWNRAQYAVVPIGHKGNPLELPDADYLLAEAKHWYHGPIDGPQTVSDTLSARAGAVSAGGYRPARFFSYQGQNGGPYIGTLKRITSVGTPMWSPVLEIQRNSLGHPTNKVVYRVDPLYNVVTASYTNYYDSSGKYLQSVRGPNGEMVRGYGYHPVVNNLLTSVTNAVGDVVRYIHDTNTMKVTSVTFPGGMVRTNIYYASGASQGFLQQQIDSQNGAPFRTNSFGYLKGNLAAHTNELGLITTYVWDDLNRLVSTKFPDNTTISNLYYRLDNTPYANSSGGTNILDVTATKDRMGYWTYYAYDGLRERTAITNANGQVTQFTYCGCGSPSSMIRYNGGTPVYTTFNYDLDGVMTNIVFPDGYQLNFGYDYRGLLCTNSDSVGRKLIFDYAQVGDRFKRVAAYMASGATLRQLSYDTLDNYGRATQSIDRNGVITTRTFDYLGRLLTRKFSGYGGVGSGDETGQDSFVYDARGLTNYNDPLGHLTVFVRDPAGRVLYQTNAENQLLQFAYNAADQLTTLIDGKTQTTTWKYNEYGRVTNKVDNLGTNLFTYQYDPNDRLTNRTTAAKGSTAYRFDPIDNLTNVIYPVSSNIVLKYDTLNRLTNMTDGVGSTAFTWTPGDQLASEDGPWASDTVSYTYNNRLHVNLGILAPNASAWMQTYGYDEFFRLTNTTSPAGGFRYQYPSFWAANSTLALPDLIQELDYPSGAFSSRAYDGLARLTNSTLYRSDGTTVLDLHAYVYDPGSLRTQQVFQAGNYMNYSYDKIDQLKTAFGFESGGGTPRSHEQFGYAYDNAGNLNYRTNNALTQTFVVNSLNELSSGSRSGTLTVAGTTTSVATNVTVSGTGLSSGSANLYADATWARPGATLTVGNGFNTYTATANDSLGRSSQDSSTTFLLGSLSFSYDLNGNLLNDLKRYFEYDDENQLISVTVSNAWRSEFSYDGFLRRRVRKEYTWSGGTWSKTNEVHYIYDSLLVTQERDANNLPTVTYTRGTDLSGTMQEAGGIGGLLARSDNALSAISSTSSHSYYNADGNGDITALTSTSQTIAAAYKYDPFGNTLSQSGTLADANTYRFSSKELHVNSGMCYFGFRFYDPNSQRWMNRDPVEEDGGINLFMFAGNRPIADADPFGLSAYPPTPPPPPAIPGGPWRWCPDSSNRRGGTFRNNKGESIDWDPADYHWDKKLPGEKTQRYNRFGAPLTKEQAHNPRMKTRPIQFRPGTVAGAAGSLETLGLSLLLGIAVDMAIDDVKQGIEKERERPRRLPRANDASTPQLKNRDMCGV